MIYKSISRGFLLTFICFSYLANAQSIIELNDCDFTYIDPQDQNTNSNESRDTLVYRTSIPQDTFLRAFYIDINAFGGQQVDRTRVLAVFEDGTEKELGVLSFGSCLSCVKGFAFMHDGTLQTQDESDPNLMQLWLESFGQPPFGIIGNLQTLNGVGRISGTIPFCATELKVVYVVNSNPNNATTEFSTHIICPQEIKSCAISKETEIDCVNNRLRLNAIIPTDCFSPTAIVEWTKDNRIISGTANFEGTLLGNEGWFFLRVTDDCCTLIDSILIENPPFVQARPDTSLCVGESITLFGSGGSGHFWEKIGGPTYQDSILALSDLSATDGGVFVLHAFNEDGCEDTDSLLLQVNPPDALLANIAEVCIGDTLILMITNSEGFNDLSWEDPFGNSTDSIILDLGPDDFGIYTANGVDQNGCRSMTTIEVSGGSLPEVSAFQEESCDSITITLLPDAYNYQWEQGIVGNKFTSRTSGTYRVTITDSEGCSTIETFNLSEPNGPEINFDVQQPICPDDNGSIRILPKDEDRPMIFSIDNGEQFTFDTFYPNLGPGHYQIVIQDDLDCIQRFDIELIRPDTLWVELDIDSSFLVVRPGTDVELSANTYGAIEEIQWLPNEINSDNLTTSFTAFNDMDIRIIVKDENECFVSDALQLSVELGDIYAPNAFSPNSDQTNENFTLYSDLGSGEIIELLQVYDRYGTLLFSKEEINLNQPKLGWDGSSNGESMTAGVYTFFGVVRFGNGAKKIIEGDVMLMR